MRIFRPVAVPGSGCRGLRRRGNGGDPRRSLHARQRRRQRRDAGTHELGLGQRFEFGAASAAGASLVPGVRLDEVRFEGAALDDGLRGTVRLSTGRRVPDWRVQQEAERLPARRSGRAS